MLRRYSAREQTTPRQRGLRCATSRSTLGLCQRETETSKVVSSSASTFPGNVTQISAIQSMSTCSGCFRSPMSKSKAPTPHEGSTINGRYMRPKSSSLPQKLWSSLKNTCSVVVVHIRFVDDTSNQPLTTSFSRVSNPKHSSNQGKYTHTCLSSGG
jgi:hypothetical protein